MDDLFDQIETARAFIAGHARLVPRVGLILGSGLGGLADELEDAAVLPYGDIPGFPVSTVHGHRGELAIGQLSGQPVMVLRGRFHFYEGYTMRQVTFPVRVMKALGCDTLIVTNAAGGLRPDWAVGDLMQIADQIFLPGMAGHHPLIGPNDDRLGLRFPPMVDAFDQELARIAHAVAGELRYCRAFADVVGMSTAPEVVVARHGGMRVLGISLVTNIALPDGPPANHIEVLEAGEAAKPKFAALLKGVLARI